jgi:hypothetical protein
VVLRGTVRDAGGNPIRGARVVLVGMTRGWFEECGAQHIQPVFRMAQDPERKGYPRQTTGAGGTYAFRNLPVPSWHVLVVTHPSFAGYARRLEITEAPVTHDVALAAGHSIAGRVLDPGGDGVAGVALSGTGMVDTPEGDMPQQRSTVSRADGSWEMDGFGKAPVRVKLVNVRAAGVFPASRSSWDVPPGSRDFILRVVVLGAVSFQALLEEPRRPLKVPLSVEVLKGSEVVRVRGLGLRALDADLGEYILRGPPGRYDLRLVPRDHHPLRAHFHIRARGQDRLGEPLLFRKGCRLHGMVIAAGSRRGLGAFVYYERLDEQPGRRTGKYTDQKGAFSFQGLARGTYRIVVLRRGMQALHARTELRGDLETRFALRPAGAAPPVRKHPYRDRRKFQMLVDLRDFTLEEAAWWLGELALAEISVSPALAGKSRLEGRTINLKVGGLSLEETVRLLTAFNNVSFDEATGTFVPKRD